MLRWSRTLALFAAALLAVGCSRQSDSGASNPRSVTTPYPNASEVRLFIHSSYDEEGKPVLATESGRTLTHDERQAFERTFRIEPAPDAVVACFIPHHFFAYFDAAGKKIGEIEVCFCCAGVRASPDIATPIGPDEVLSADYKTLEKLIQSMGEPTDIEC